MISPLVNVDVASRSTLTAGGALPVVVMVLLLLGLAAAGLSSGVAVEARFDRRALMRPPMAQPAPDQGDGEAPPLVSVIIATYNAGTLLAHALDALAIQSLPARLIEVIVVDDGSTDGTWRYLSELQERDPTSRSSGSRTPVVPARCNRAIRSHRDLRVLPRC